MSDEDRDKAEADRRGVLRGMAFGFLMEGFTVLVIIVLIWLIKHL